MFSFAKIKSMAEDQVADVEKLTPSPVGEVKMNPEIFQYIQTLIDEWNKIRGSVTGSKFWSKSMAGMHKATQFLLRSIDGLVVLVDDLIDKGADKKATVLNALDTLYDYVVREAIPFWLRPFAGIIKNYVIFTLASSAIDWIVSKYREGTWNKEVVSPFDETQQS